MRKALKPFRLSYAIQWDRLETVERDLLVSSVAFWDRLASAVKHDSWRDLSAPVMHTRCLFVDEIGRDEKD